MLLQPARHRQRRLVLALHPQRERLQSADEEEGALRVEHAAEHAAQILDGLHQARPPAHGPGEQVVVAARYLVPECTTRSTPCASAAG